MTIKADRIRELVDLYNVPISAADLCVDDEGGVNHEKLAVAVNTVTAIKDGLTQRDQVEIEQLKGQLKDLREKAKNPNENKQAIAQLMMRTTDLIFKLGGRP